MTYIATQLPEAEIHQLGQLFEQIDTNSDGFLTIEELKTALDRQQEKTSIAELKGILDHIDTDRNGKINYNEFLACCLETSFLQNEAYLQYIFKGLDSDNSGKISKQEIKKVLNEVNINNTSAAFIDKVIDGCDKNGDGEIDYLEFLEAMGLKK